MGFLTKTGWYLDNDQEAKELLAKFNGVRMEDLNLTEAQAAGLLGYIEEASRGPAAPEEEPEPEVEEQALKVRLPDEGLETWLPGVAAALVILAAGLAAWHAGLTAAAAALVLLSAGLGYWSFGGRRYHQLLGAQQGYAPTQPIDYSHETHAGRLKIDCVYCHSGAPRSDVAGVPPVQTCMNCHNVVRKSSGSKDPSVEIAKLVAAWETRASTAPRGVAWNRVHDLPDYAHFSHRVHVANNIKCQECHGPVQEMKVMRQASSLSMGWCLECHRKDKTTAPTHWKRTGGPQDCAACHW